MDKELVKAFIEECKQDQEWKERWEANHIDFDNYFKYSGEVEPYTEEYALYIENRKNMQNLYWCKSCLNMSTRPRIEFNKNQICNGCKTNDEKKKVDWSVRKKEFLDICKIIKMKNLHFQLKQKSLLQN